MANKPHVHKDVIIAYANGAEIEFKSTEGWVKCANPSFYPFHEYRVKPRPLVKKYRWVVASPVSTLLQVTEGVYASAEEFKERNTCSNMRAIQKVDSTMIEVEGDSQI